MATRTIHAVGVLAALAAVSAGCGKRPPVVAPVRIVETVEIKVPVPVRREAPRELLAAYVPESVPEFVAPADPAASSALTAENERRLRALINDLLARIAAWQAWATAPEPP